MIFLVVLLHAGLVYESSGITAFFWIVDDPSTNDLSGILNLIIDIFAMPAIFFVSGFFVLHSLKNKKGLDFVKSKFKRLIVPWAIAVLTLLPLYKVIFLYSRNLPQEDWTTYFHWSNGIWDQNWLWFLPVLFLFDVLYLFFSRLNLRIPGISLNRAVWAAFLIAFVYSSGMAVFHLQGWTKTFLMDFQNERILIYFLIFLLGSLCYELKTFESKPKSKRLYVAVACTSWLPVNLYLLLVIRSFLKPGSYLFSEIADTILIQGSYLVSLLSLLYLLINTFRYYLNRQGDSLRELNRNSYGVYIIHVIVMGGLALIMLNTPMPSISKHFVLAVLTYAVSNVIVCFYRKVIIPLLKVSSSEATILGRAT
jgi:hypothetical protein